MKNVRFQFIFTIKIFVRVSLKLLCRERYRFVKSLFHCKHLYASTIEFLTVTY